MDMDKIFEFLPGSRKRQVFVLDSFALVTIAFLFDLLVMLFACMILLRFSEEDRIGFVNTWFTDSFHSFEEWQHVHRHVEGIAKNAGSWAV